MRTLAPKELEPGMILAQDVRTPIGQELATKGTEVTRQLINRMKLYKVESACVEGEDPSAPAPKTHAQESKTHSQKIAASSEFRDFQFGYIAAIDELKKAFVAAERKEQIDTDALLTVVSKLFQSKTIGELFDMLFNMRIMEDAVYAHCLNVGLVSRMIGRWLKLEKHNLDVLTLAGLLHDIGKIKIPNEVLEKPGKPTDEEYEMIKKHPKLGYEMLKNQKLDPHVRKAALMHHERCDGSGYPSGLEEDFIDEYAMIVGIADVYDAMTAARSYRAPLCPFQVISNFEKEGYQKYHAKYIITFLKQIAATYQSNRVVLSDGRGCNIVMLNQNALSRPMVQFDDNTILDLSTQKELYIKSVL